MNTAALPAPDRRAGRRILLLVLALSLMPVVIGGGLYVFGWRPAHGGNHGELIQPPRPLPATGLSREDGTPLPTAELRGKWTLVLAGDGACGDACVKRLQQMRQIQVALNKEMGRVRRLALLPDPADPLVAAARAAQPDLLVARPDAAWRATLGTAPEHHFYLIDPLGQLIMQYAPNADPKGVQQDLDRLLKYSWVG